jgi:deoxycytidylate deaminase
VVRCDKNSKLQDSAPCESCLTTIIELNIKRIVFSSKNGEFISENPKKLEICHVSAGNKYLQKREEDKAESKSPPKKRKESSCRVKSPRG